MDGELNVRAAGFDADFANHCQRRVAHPLVFFVGERLGRGHGDRIAGVDAHRVEVFDRADDHDVVVGVAHHLHFVFFPAEDAFFDEHLVHGRKIEPAADRFVEFLAVVGEAAAAAAQREAGANDAGEADFFDRLAGFFQRLHRVAAREIEPDALHGLLEQLAIFGFGDHVGVGADHFDAEFFEDAVLGQVHRQVQPGLAAQRGQQGVGPLGFDHFGHHFPSERLDVGAVGRARVGHDGGRVGVHQHDFVPFFAQRFAGLRAGIVEFARLADDDRAGADDQNFANIVAAWHGRSFLVKLRM